MMIAFGLKIEFQLPVDIAHENGEIFGKEVFSLNFSY